VAGDAKDFLGLTHEEVDYIEMKMALCRVALSDGTPIHPQLIGLEHDQNLLTLAGTWLIV
jgi:hypothetical protein